MISYFLQLYRHYIKLGIKTDYCNTCFDLKNLKNSSNSLEERNEINEELKENREIAFKTRQYYILLLQSLAKSIDRSELIVLSIDFAKDKLIP